MTRLLTRWFVLASAVLGVVAGTAGRAEANLILDPVNDFIPSYTAGPRNGDLDVTSVGVTFNGTRFVLTATLNGSLGTTPGALYVWGVDRGAGTARFADIAPGVRFDSVVALQANATGSVTRIIGGGNSPLSPGDVTVSGSTLTASVPASFLPSQGRAEADYTFNLWPRLGTGNNNQISDFAPDNSNIRATVVSEPNSVVLASLGGLILLARWRWKARRG